MNCCYTDEHVDRCENRRAGELPMCDRHMRRTFRNALIDGALPADVFKAICQDAIDELGIRMQYRDVPHSAHLEHARRRAAEEAATKVQKPGTVYYVRLTGDRIKIGWTRDLETRMAAFRARMDDVLATEPGTMADEARRHREFTTERIGRSEEFKQSDRLLAHIARLAAQSA